MSTPTKRSDYNDEGDNEGGDEEESLDNEEEGDNMASDIQAFMLSGSGKKKKKKKKKQTPQKQNRNPAPSPAPTPQLSEKELLQQRIKKEYWRLLNAYQKSLKDDWIDTDDHLGRVVASIANLRQRIRSTSKQLFEAQETPSYNDPPTMGSGYRARHPGGILFALTKDDLELALHHGFVQHEKMLSGARKLISALNESQDALGRRLDDLMMYHYENPLLFEEDVDQELEQFCNSMVEWCRDVFAILADELYRKQLMVQSLVDEESAHDGLLFTNVIDDLPPHKLNEINEKPHPLDLAQKCLEKWPRGGAEQEDQEKMERLLSATPWEPPKTPLEQYIAHAYPPLKVEHPTVTILPVD